MGASSHKALLKTDGLNEAYLCKAGVSQPLGELLMGERRALSGAGHHGDAHDDRVRVELAFHVSEVIR